VSPDESAKRTVVNERGGALPRRAIGPVALVVQRYGPDVTGGSESLARALAERLAAEGVSTTVFTTCARDYVTWRNELPAGEHDLGGVSVRRFPVEEERDLLAFNRFGESLYDRPHTDEDERAWLRRQGPYVPRLVEALRAAQDHFQAILFFTYLYYPTVEGLRAAPGRSILVPTTHDEPPLRFRLYRDLFERARAFAFLTPAEEALVRSRFEIGDRPALVAGMGVDDPTDVDVAGFRARHSLEDPYLLYAGRIDAGKGCADMLRYYDRYRARFDASAERTVVKERGGALPRRAEARPADLVLIGRLAMDQPAGEGVRYLGFVSEEDKQAAFAGASLVICPSAYESLSIALLEGFARGVPGLVNARSAVLKEHCLLAQGGLYYEDGLEFVEALETLMADEPLRRALGEGGRRHVARRYRWDVVMERYRSLIDAVGPTSRLSRASIPGSRPAADV
jgi:glycosyltransferase involved in cell wall biosynthesis